MTLIPIYTPHGRPIYHVASRSLQVIAAQLWPARLAYKNWKLVIVYV